MEPEISDPSSLDAVLEQMEVSTGPDLDSQELITACAEDLHLGGEVEIRDRDVMEARQPSSSGSQKHRDAEAGGEHSEAAGMASAITNFIFQGGAPGEDGERVEDAIAMEIEVTRKSTSSEDGSVSPAAQSSVRDQVLPEAGGDWGRVVAPSDAGGGQVGGHGIREPSRGGGSVRGKRTRRGRGRKRGLYVPPVTEWRDFLDSQDVLQEYARNVEREEGRGGEEESQREVREHSEREGEEEVGGGQEEGANGEAQKVVVEEVEEREKEEGDEVETEVGGGVVDVEGGGVVDVEGGGVVDVEGGGVVDVEGGDSREEGGTEGRIEEEEVEIPIEVENMETGEEEDHHDHPSQAGDDGSDSALVEAVDPNQLDMFLPSRVPIHRQAPPASRAATTSGLSRCLDVAECFLEQEGELLEEAKWVSPPSGGDLRQPLAQAGLHPDPTAVALHNNDSRTERSSPPHSSGVVSTENPTTAPVINSLSPVRPTVQSNATSSRALLRDKAEKAGGSSALTGEHMTTAVIRNGKAQERTEKAAEQSTTRRSPLAIHPQSHGGGSTALRDEDAHSDSSFFYHDSQMMDIGEGEERERPVTLCSPSASSEYESAAETHTGRDSRPDQHEPADGGSRHRFTGEITLQRLTGSQTATSCTQRNSEEVNHTNAAVIPASNLTEEARRLLQHTSVTAREDVDAWRGANERRIEGQAGRKGKKPQPKECRVNVWKIPAVKVEEAFSSEESGIFDFFSNIFPGVSSIGCRNNWTNFHNFVDNLRLPSVGSKGRRRKTTSESSRPLRSRSPPLDNRLSSSLFESNRTASRLPKPDAWTAFNELVENNLPLPGCGGRSQSVSVSAMDSDCHRPATRRRTHKPSNTTSSATLAVSPRSQLPRQRKSSAQAWNKAGAEYVYLSLYSRV